MRQSMIINVSIVGVALCNIVRSPFKLLGKTAKKEEIYILNKNISSFSSRSSVSEKISESQQKQFIMIKFKCIITKSCPVNKLSLGPGRMVVWSYGLGSGVRRVVRSSQKNIPSLFVLSDALNEIRLTCPVSSFSKHYESGMF